MEFTSDMRQCPPLTSSEELSLACLHLAYYAVIAFYQPSGIFDSVTLGH